MKIQISVIKIFLIAFTIGYSQLHAQTITGLKEINSPCIIANFSSAGSASTDGMLKGPNYSVYSGIIKNEFKMMQIGNWIPSNWLGANSYSFTDINEMVNWCEGNGIQSWGLWTFGNNLYIPDWLKNGKYTNEQLDTMMHKVIVALLSANHNSTKVETWCVMNEMFKDDGTYYDMKFNQLGWEADQSGITGADQINKQHPVFIRKVLKYFRENTAAKLEIRDYNFAYMPGNNMVKKSKAIYQLIKHLVASNSPIDAVSEQAHIALGSLSNTSKTDNYANMRNYIKSIKDLGLEFYISECDITEGDGATWNENKNQQQKIDYNNFVYEIINAGVTKFSPWGIKDGNDKGWKPNEHPLMWTNKLVAKPAYFGVHDALSGKTSAPDNGFKATNFSNKSPLPLSDGNLIKNFLNDEWLQFDNVALTATQNMIKLRLASAVNGGTIEIHKGSLDGDLIGTIPVPNTGNINSYTNDVCAEILPQSGTFNLVFVYKNLAAGECNFDWFHFISATEASTIIQAEDFMGKSSSPYISGGAINATRSSHWLEYIGLKLNGETKFKARVSSGGGGGKIEIRTGSVTGKLIGTLSVSNTVNWDTYVEFSASIIPQTGVFNVFIVFQGNGGGVCNLDWFQFSKEPTGLQVLDENSLTPLLYPNPISNKVFNIDASAINYSGNIQITILDIAGQVICKNAYNSNTKIAIPIENRLKTGVYFLQVKYSNKKFVDKLVVL